MLKKVSKDKATKTSEMIKIAKSNLFILYPLILMINIITRVNILTGKLISNNYLILLWI